MNGNAELLNFVYQNAQMGMETIKQLLGIAEDAEFREHLSAQLGEYRSILETAKELLNKNGFDEKGISSLSKLKTYMTISMETLTDKSSAHIAEMMIIGSNMGILDATKNIKKYEGAEKSILALMKRLLTFEEHNVQQLKHFL